MSRDNVVLQGCIGATCGALMLESWEDETGLKICK